MARYSLLKDGNSLSFSEEDAAAFVEANKSHVIRLRKTITNLMTMRHVLYYYDRLNRLKHDGQSTASADRVMEAEAFMTTIVMSYGRLFAESTGVRVLIKKLIPEHLLDIHEEIISFRNERYAHHGNHATTAAELEMFVSEDDVEMQLHWRSSMYNGAPPHWRALFEWVDEYLKESFKKQMSHLSKTSGKEWIPFEPQLEIRSVKVDDVDGLDIPPLFESL